MPRCKDLRFRRGAPSYKPSFVRAEWLEELVWSDVRRFLENPGEVLERLREQHDAADDAGELEARRKELANGLAAKQAERDRYIKAYAQGHVSEEELDVYLADLKNQIDNLRVLVASIEAKLSETGTDSADGHHTRLASLAQATPRRGRGGYARGVREAQAACQVARGVDLAWQEAARRSGRGPDNLPFRPAPGVRN